MSDVIYTGIFFDFTEFECTTLLSHFLDWEQMYLHDSIDEFVARHALPNVFLHHLTLQFRPDPDGEHVRNVLEHEGREIRVKVVGTTRGMGYIGGDRVWALEVEPDPLRMQEFRIECANDTPHLTVATAEGVKPFEANKATFDRLAHTFALTGRLGVFRGE